MGFPAAKKGDRIVSTGIHIVTVQLTEGPVPPPLSHPFAGIIDGNLSQDVKIMGLPAATVDSEASSQLPNISPGGLIQSPSLSKARIKLGSGTVKINGKMAARNGDKATISNDLSGLRAGTVIATGTVFIG